jgi:hypothetical protein
MDPEIPDAGLCCILLDKKNRDIFDKLQEAYGEGCVSYAWAGKWVKTCREGRTSLAHDRGQEDFQF